MEFTEKLDRLSRRDRSTISKKAGLPNSAISNYVSRKQIPRADTALKLARALKVPIEWLIDDEQGWPPPAGEAKLAKTLTDGALLAELLQRTVLERVDLLDKLERANKVDWTAQDKVICDVPNGTSVPRDTASLVSFIHSVLLGQLNSSTKYDLRSYEAFMDRLVIPANRRIEELDPKKLDEAFRSFVSNWDFQCFVGHLFWKAENLPEAEREKLRALPSLMKLINHEVNLSDFKPIPPI